ncbi:MAG: S41 family peptidase [Planctomycetaceae bacterium]
MIRAFLVLLPLVMLPFCGPSQALGEDPKPVVDVPSWPDAQSALRAGEVLETSRQWADAIEIYTAALKTWATDEPLKYALRRARIHLSIDRRYSDTSFEQMLSNRGEGELLNLWEDILRQVQREYIDQVSVTRFTSHGTESLYMALRNDRFLEQNLLASGDGAIRTVRETLVREYWNRPVSSIAEARSVIRSTAALCQQQLGLSPTSVLLEYIFGGCNALDEYSNLLTPDRYNDLYGSIQGELVGIGIEMKADHGKGMHLVNVLIGSPAEEGGLRAADHIIAIDGTDCREFTTDEAARLLRGTAGSRVRLTWQNPSAEEFTGDFVRRRVQIRSVTRKMMLDPVQGIGYIRMEGFQDSTAQELDEALRSLERQGMRALIWDLRGNPGGLLDTAAAVSERFIDRGVLVSTRGRADGQNQEYRAQSQYARKYPLALIVDENSASASEIVAGAIRDHQRGVIVGRKTYGKWSVQTIVRLPGDSGMALRLTTAKFYSPNKRNYSGEGIAPDLLVDADDDREATYFRGRTQEEISADPDVARALEALETRMSRN